MDSESKTESRVVEDLEKKQPGRPSTSQMVMETIKSLNMINGASLGAIKAFIGEYYDANENFRSARIQRSLENGVEKGLLEQVADGDSMRYKLKKPTRQEIKTKPQVKEFSKKKNHSASDSTEKSTPKGKISTPSLPQMAVESIKALKMRNGAPVEAISRHMEEHYGVNVKAVTPNLKRFLKTGVQKGVLENTSKDGADGRFKVRKMAEVVRMRKSLKSLNSAEPN